MKVTTIDGIIAERTFAFNRRIELPIIDSNTIKLQPDLNGNLIWTWKIPMELGQLALNHKTRVRASIDIYKNEKIVGYFYIILPVHLAFIFIPTDVAQTINQKGDRFELKIQIETKDKNNRTYSKPLVTNKLLPIANLRPPAEIGSTAPSRGLPIIFPAMLVVDDCVYLNANIFRTSLAKTTTIGNNLSIQNALN